MFEELILEVTKMIEGVEGRKRSRTTDEQSRFRYAVLYILTDLWKASHSIPAAECSINRRSGYYSENPRYRDVSLTYKQVRAAFEGLHALDLIEVTKEGHFDHVLLEGSLTRYIARDELLDKLQQLEGSPALSIKPDLDRETIILRDKINGQKKAIAYEDTPKTDEYRRNLKTIHNCFLRHWADLEIKDNEIALVAERIDRDKDKLPIDFSARILVRIFSNGSFKEGGRFYRGWWQNVPSEYRKHITLDMKKTCEYDFSQLNPHMLYFAYNKELGSEDAYSRVFDGEHRDLVKAAFNAMLQSDTPLTSCPEDIDPSVADISWRELRERIMAAHKPIEHLFFSGEGNKLQFEDSCIADSVMLQFAAIDAPALPVHDSFIMHHGYGGELEEAMRRAFHERRGSDIPVKHETITWRRSDETLDETSSLDEILEADAEYSQWKARNEAWFAQRK
jgi:hypothetical protein